MGNARSGTTMSLGGGIAAGGTTDFEGEIANRELLIKDRERRFGGDDSVKTPSVNITK